MAYDGTIMRQSWYICSKQDSKHHNGFISPGLLLLVLDFVTTGPSVSMHSLDLKVADEKLAEQALDVRNTDIFGSSLR